MNYLIAIVLTLATAFHQAHAAGWEPSDAGKAPVTGVHVEENTAACVSAPSYNCEVLTVDNYRVDGYDLQVKEIIVTMPGRAWFKGPATVHVTTVRYDGATVTRDYRMKAETAEMATNFTLSAQSLVAKASSPERAQFESLYAQLKDAVRITATVEGCSLSFDSGKVRKGFNYFAD